MQFMYFNEWLCIYVCICRLVYGIVVKSKKKTIVECELSLQCSVIGYFFHRAEFPDFEQ